jgi:phytol kinase
MAVALTILTVFTLLVVNEVLWRKQKKHSELNRKFIHITVGTFVAFWPFFLSWNEIRLLCVAFLVGVGLSKYFRIFQAIHSVERPTWGEVFFAVAVGAITFITHSKGVYATALLQMSLADGLAAVTGKQYGSRYEYKVLGHTKSLIGTGTFLLLSYIVLLGYSLYSAAFGVTTSLMVAILATLVENVSVLGLDNLLVPVLIALAIRVLS